MAFEIVCCVSLRDPTLYHHLMPLARQPQISRIWIVRHRKIDRGDMPKARYILVPTRSKIWRFFRMIGICLQLARRKQVRAFVSFNPIPYGLFAFLAAKLYKKPIHFGFIGSDWNVHVKGRWGRFLLPFIRCADFITATGPNTQKEMTARDIPARKITILPHSIDLNRFTVGDPSTARYTAIFIGNLIHLKRVDLILQAFAQVIKSHPRARLCIVGDGPLAQPLKQQARKLDISQAVDFVGYVNDVRPYLADARMVIIASEHEGFPFALVEGICTGLVPVSTPVGTIPHMIADGENGLLFPAGDADALAQSILRLLNDEEFYQRLRNNSLQRRTEFAYDNAAAVWQRWLHALPNTSKPYR